MTNEDLSKLPEPALYARLVVLAPHRTELMWRSVLNLPEPFRTETLKAWSEEGDDWAQKPDHWATVVAVVSAIVSVAGGIGTIAGAVGAVRSVQKS
jgi:hypothetical protein